VSTSTVLILGASSDIGLALGRRYTQAGTSVILAARDPEALKRDQTDLELRASAGSAQQFSSFPFDVIGGDPRAFFDALGTLPDTVICVVGLLGNQQISQRDPAAATLVMESNYAGPVRFLQEAALRMEARGHGVIVGISSVAGDRARASNYLYGSAKAGFTAFLAGLRNRLARRGVHVLTVKPGFVATRMTAGMRLPPLLTAQPDEVAQAIVHAAQRKRDVLYVRPVWRWIMMVIRCVPETLFKRMSL